MTTIKYNQINVNYRYVRAWEIETYITLGRGWDTFGREAAENFGRFWSCLEDFTLKKRVEITLNTIKMNLEPPKIFSISQGRSDFNLPKVYLISIYPR